VEGWFSPHPLWWSDILRQTGFTEVPEPNSLTPGFVIFKDEEATKERLQNHFYYTWGDSDLF